MTETHALLSPSKLDRIIRCPGSVQASMLYEDQPSAYAQEGTMLHKAVYDAALSGIESVKYLDLESKNAVQDCLDYKQTLINSFDHNAFDISYEYQVTLTPWGIPEVYGTLDCGILNKSERHAHIIDWKFGKGIPVYALWNAQLMSYGAGFIGYPPIADLITFHIVQPRINNYDTWTISVEDLTEWINTTLKEAIVSSQVAKPVFNPGEKQCRFCPAKNKCFAKHEQTEQDAKRIFDAATNIKEVTNEEISEVLSIIPRLKNSIKDIQEYAFMELERGREMPGFKLVQGKSNRKWVDEDKALEWLKKQFNDSDFNEVFYTHNFMSCAQIEKLDRTLKNNPEFQELFETPEGKKILAPETDKRKAVNPSALDVFKDIDI